MNETAGEWQTSIDPPGVIDDPETLLSCLPERLEQKGPVQCTGEVAEALGRLVLIAHAALSGQADIGAAVAAMHTLLDDIEHQR